MLLSYFSKGRTFLFNFISNPKCVSLKIITSLVTEEEHTVIAITDRYQAITKALRFRNKPERDVNFQVNYPINTKIPEI